MAAMKRQQFLGSVWAGCVGGILFNAGYEFFVRHLPPLELLVDAAGYGIIVALLSLLVIRLFAPHFEA